MSDLTAGRTEELLTLLMATRRLPIFWRKTRNCHVPLTWAEMQREGVSRTQLKAMLDAGLVKGSYTFESTAIFSITSAGKTVSEQING